MGSSKLLSSSSPLGSSRLSWLCSPVSWPHCALMESWCAVSHCRSQLPDTCACLCATGQEHWPGFCYAGVFPRAGLPTSSWPASQWLYGCGWTKHRGTSSLLLARDGSCSVKMLPLFPGSSQQLAKGLSGLPWHVQEAFGRNERQNQGLSNLQVCTYRQNLSLLECHRDMVRFCPHAAPYGSPSMQSPFLTAFQTGECTLLSTKGSAALKELKDSC